MYVLPLLSIDLQENQQVIPSPSQKEARIDEGDEEEEEETRIDVTIPYCRVPLGSELYFSKLPNFLSVETKPFDANLYEDDVEEDEILDEEGRARLKLKVHIIINNFNIMYSTLGQPHYLGPRII